jgi:hypothetical protein
MLNVFAAVIACDIAAAVMHHRESSVDLGKTFSATYIFDSIFREAER